MPPPPLPHPPTHKAQILDHQEREEKKRSMKGRGSLGGRRGFFRHENILDVMDLDRSGFGWIAVRKPVSKRRSPKIPLQIQPPPPCQTVSRLCYTSIHLVKKSGKAEVCGGFSFPSFLFWIQLGLMALTLIEKLSGLFDTAATPEDLAYYPPLGPYNSCDIIPYHIILYHIISYMPAAGNTPLPHVQRARLEKK